MNSFLLNPFDEDLNDQSDGHTQADSEAVHSMNEGSEYLDDAIRMIDLPLMFSDEKIDSGGSRYLF